MRIAKLIDFDYSDDLLGPGFEDEFIYKVLELANNGVTSPLHTILFFLVLTFKVDFRNEVSLDLQFIKK